MSFVNDYSGVGYFPLQDWSFKDQDVDLGAKQGMAAVRLTSTKGASGSSPSDAAFKIGMNNEMGTAGDIHPWMFWQVRDRGKRHMGSWAQVFLTNATDTDGIYNKTTVQPVGNLQWQVDNRYKGMDITWPLGLARPPRGSILLALPSTDETQQDNLAVWADNRLIASNVSGPGQCGTLVCDLQPNHEICMDGEVEPGMGGRHARLQTLVRVIAVPRQESFAGLGGGGNVLALNYARTGQERTPSYGAVWISLDGPGSYQGPTTGGQTGPITGPNSGSASSGLTSGNAPSGTSTRTGSLGDNFGHLKNGSGSFGSGRIDKGETEEERKIHEWGQFSPKPTGGEGVACMASGPAFGPMHGGSSNDKHILGTDADGNPINSGHISAGAFFYRSALKDAPLAFTGKDYPGAGSMNLTALVHLSYDGNTQHAHAGGLKQGMWRWYAESPTLIPTTGGGGGKPTGGPVTGGPTGGGRTGRPERPSGPTTGGPSGGGRRDGPTTGGSPSGPSTGGPVGPSTGGGTSGPTTGRKSPAGRDPFSNWPRPKEDGPITGGGHWNAGNIVGEPSNPGFEYRPPGDELPPGEQGPTTSGPTGPADEPPGGAYAGWDPVRYGNPTGRPWTWYSDPRHLPGGDPGPSPTGPITGPRKNQPSTGGINFNGYGEPEPPGEGPTTGGPQGTGGPGGPSGPTTGGGGPSGPAAPPSGPAGPTTGGPGGMGAMLCKDDPHQNIPTWKPRKWDSDWDKKYDYGRPWIMTSATSTGAGLHGSGGEPSAGDKVAATTSPTYGRMLGHGEFSSGTGTGGAGDSGTMAMDPRADMGRIDENDPMSGMPSTSPGVVPTVGSSSSSHVAAFAVFNPTSTGFAAVTFRPQLWVDQYPNFEHNPLIPGHLVHLDEAERPQVLAMRAWGGMSPASGDFRHVEKPLVSRARGGTAHGGVLFSPPRFEMEDYFSIGPAQDVDDVTSARATRSYVMAAPGVCFALGKPNQDGTIASNGVTISQTAGSSAALLIAHNTKDVLKAYDDGTDVMVELGRGGNAAVVLPAGTTAQRPATPAQGQIRIATNAVASTDKLEYYDSQNTAWVQLAGPASGSILLSGYTMNTGRILARTSGSSGPVEEITVPSDGALALSGGTLALKTGANGEMTISSGSSAYSVTQTTLAALKAVTPAANKLAYFTGASAAAVTDLSAFARTLIDDADAEEARQTLEVGNTEQHSVWWQDYLIPSASALGWSSDSASGGSGQSWETITDASNATGVFELRTGTSRTGRYSLLSWNNALVFDNETAYTFEARVNIQALSTGSEEFNVTFGFSNSFDEASAHADETDYAFWIYRRTVDGDFWVAATARNGTEQKTVTTTAPVGDDTTFVVLKIVVPADGSSVTYYIDGVEKAEHETNVPQVTDRMGIGLRIDKTVGTTQREFRVDWHRFVTTRTAAR